MSASKLSDLGYPAILNIIRSAGNSVQQLLDFRLRGQLYRQIVDEEIYDIWARILTTRDIERAFENDFIQVVKQAYWTLGWYQKTESVEIDNPKSPSGYETIHVSNASKFNKPPAIATFDFAKAFITNYFADIDEFFVGEGLVDVADDHGVTALIYSAFVANESFPMYLERVRRLIKAGANVNIQDDEGATALMLIVRSRFFGLDVNVNPIAFEVAKLLIAARANLDLANTQKDTAIYFASKEYSNEGHLGHLHGMRGLTKIAVKKLPPLTYNPKEENIFIELLARAGANVDIAVNGRSLFVLEINNFVNNFMDRFTLSSSWTDKIVAILSGQGNVDVNIKMTLGRTPVMYILDELWTCINRVSQDSTRLGYLIKSIVEIIQAMTPHNLDLLAVDNYGATVFHRALEPKTLEILLEYAKNTNQIAALNVARDNGKFPLNIIADKYVIGANKDMLIASGRLMLKYGAKHPPNVTNIVNITDDAFLRSVFNVAEPAPPKYRFDDEFAYAIKELDKKFSKQEVIAAVNAILEDNNKNVASEAIFHDKLSVEILQKIAKSLSYDFDPNWSKEQLVKNLVDRRNSRLGIASPARY